MAALSANAQISGGLPPVKKSEPQKITAPIQKNTNAQSKSEVQIAAEREDAFWSEIKTLASKEAYEIYIKRYPNGRYVEIAKASIQSLTPVAPSYSAQNNSSSDANQLRTGMVLKDCPECPTLVVVPAGVFQMGAQPGEEERENVPENLKNRSQPQHEVKIKSFLAGINEVTLAQYESFVQATARPHLGGCNVWNGIKFEVDESKDWKNPGFSQAPGHPVVCVTYYDAKAYADWLKQKTGKEYRLMSESEWEYAARGGWNGSRFWGENRNLDCTYANSLDLQAKMTVTGFGTLNVKNCNDGYSYTSQVGYYKANSFGLFDMLGNVFEWTSDCWNATYDGAPTDGSTWVAGSCSSSVIRGGGWASAVLSVSRRGPVPKSFRSSSVGIRVALSISN